MPPTAAETAKEKSEAMAKAEADAKQAAAAIKG